MRVTLLLKEVYQYQYTINKSFIFHVSLLKLPPTVQSKGLRSRWALLSERCSNCRETDGKNRNIGVQGDRDELYKETQSCAL